jgi:hypothetical protein
VTFDSPSSGDVLFENPDAFFAAARSGGKKQTGADDAGDNNGRRMSPRGKKGGRQGVDEGKNERRRRVGRGRSLRRRRGGMLRDDRTYCKVMRRRMIMNRRMASRASRSVQLQVLH